MQPAKYRILIAGTLPAEELREFVGMRLVAQRGSTSILEGTLSDQPALLGTVVRLEELGCSVRDIYVIEPDDAEGELR